MTENTDPAAEVDTTAEEAPSELPAGGKLENVEAPEAEEVAAEDEQFPREYVEKLRAENGKYRQRAQQADTLAQRLHTELVRATGKLADPTDLPFDESHLDDPEKLSEAIDNVLHAKPHLASRRPSGDIGQGHRGPATAGFSLLELLKQRT